MPLETQIIFLLRDVGMILIFIGFIWVMIQALTQEKPKPIPGGGNKLKASQITLAVGILMIIVSYFFV